MTSSRRPPAVVLVRPTEEGNVGAAARAMANFGLDELILVEPAVEIGATARAFAVHAGQILDHARRAPDLASALAPFDRVAGTSSQRARAPAGSAVTARELPEALTADPPESRAALVFGPERSGLTKEELARLDPVVVIPTSPVQPTLNLAQAVLVVAYEIFQARPEAADRPDPAHLPASFDEVQGLVDHLRQVLESVGFARDDTAASTLRDLRRFFARAAPSQREVTILRGVCRRILGTVERLGGR